MEQNINFDKEYIWRLLDEVLGKVYSQLDNLDDEDLMRNLTLHEIALKHIWFNLMETAYQVADKRQPSAVRIMQYIDGLSKEHIGEVKEVIDIIEEKREQ